MQVLTTLGVGAFGRVVMARHTSGKVYALKQISKASLMRNQLEVRGPLFLTASNACQRKTTYTMSRCRTYNVILCTLLAQQHVRNEKAVMLQLNGPFLLKLHNTFQDSRFL